MENLGLNQFLMPINSPIAQNMGAVDPYTYDYLNERGVVNNSKIRTVTADKMITGTLVAGVGVPPSNLNNGTLTTAINVGTGLGSVIIDGPNNRILIHDGTNPRIVIGNI